MLINFIKVILRYLQRSKFFAIINVTGLSIGIACTLVIYLYIRHEYSYDNFHERGDSIYRVLRVSQMNGIPYHIGVTSGPYMAALQEDFSGRINDAVRAMPFDGLIKVDDKAFIEEHLLLADKNFFTFFSYPLVNGDPSNVLTHANNVVISKAIARKYFGETDPIGKTLRLEDEYDLQVAAVMEDFPGNTHLQFDIVGSLELVEHEDWFTEWWNNGLYTYLRIENPDDVEFLKAGFSSFMDKYFGEDFKRVGSRMDLTLEPLKEIYFNNDTRFEGGIVHGDKKYIVIFASVGILLILLASINYMNLATAQASQRAKEVGIRKTLGSSKAKIAIQFLSESMVLCLLSIVIAITIVQFSVPLFESKFGIHLAGLLSDKWVVVFLSGMLVIMSLLAGSYPSLMLASYQPVKVLKGEVRGEWSYVFLRKALVVFQFGISIFMIIATLFIGRQLTFMHKKDLGFDQDKVMVVRINNGTVGEQHETFKNRLLTIPGVQSAAFMSGHPGGFHDASSIEVEGEPDQIRMRTLWTDEDFTKTLDIPLVSGRSFSKDFPADATQSIMINETAVKQLGWTNEEALGKRMMISLFDSTYKQVIGVVKDYHYTSLRDKIEPLIISTGVRSRELAVKLSGENGQAPLKEIEKVWNEFGSGYPLDWFFLDQDVNQLYHKEQVQSGVFSLFSVISVFIASLGIFGLTSYIAVQRRKEIGIRKILGASSQQVSVLLMKDMIALVIVSNVIAIPIGFWAMREWLSGFAYRISLEPQIFLLGATGVIVVAALIVGVRAIITASENPVKAIRIE